MKIKREKKPHKVSKFRYDAKKEEGAEEKKTNKNRKNEKPVWIVS